MSKADREHELNDGSINVLVVGDWIVDEHWLMGVHRSRTSSRVGRAHYRSIQNLSSTVTSFCGAGRTAAILYRAAAVGQKSLYNLMGLGVWHSGDNVSLEAMLDPAAVKQHTPHQLRLTYEAKDCRAKLVNLVHNASPDSAPGTTKVIRIYQQTGSQVKLIERLDWEIKSPESGWFSVSDLKDHLELKDALANLKKKRTAIIVKDLLKGAVSSELIGFLSQKLPEANWFISSKKYLPPWIQEIKRDKISLIEIPQAAMEHALEGEQAQLNSWLTRLGKPSKGALTLLDDLGHKFPNTMLVAVPNDQTVLAHRQKERQGSVEKEGAFWVNRQPNPSSVGLPMASVCFAAFVAHLLSTPDHSLSETVDLSLSFTEEWRAYEAGRLESPLDWDPTKEPQLNLSADPGTPAIRSEALDWSSDLERWKAAYTGLGVITQNSKKSIELWRAMTEVRNYVCIAASKRKILQKVVHEIQAFKREHGTRSSMIIAAPGSGKSLLAQLLAEDHGLYFLEFNITQMISKTDILDCFDGILTTQFENPGRQLLVFVDEIDAHLGAEPVYDAFLAPLERGVYRRAGKTFPIEPCFWLFAGTKDPTETKERKASDFVSRLTLKPVELVVDKGDDCQLENVYLGVAILRTEFPDVREVSIEVLRVFHDLEQSISIRELRQFIRDFVDIKSGEVRWSNVPPNWFNKLQIKDRGKLQREVMVEVRGEGLTSNILARFTPESMARGAKAGSR
jgi:hypothetical protein